MRFPGNMQFIVVAGISLAESAGAFGGTALTSVPAPKAWAESQLAEISTSDLGYPRKLVVLSDADDGGGIVPHFFTVDTQMLASQGYLQVIAANDAELSFSLNAIPVGSQEKNHSLLNSFALLDADAIVQVDTDSKSKLATWKLIVKTSQGAIKTLRQVKNADPGSSTAALMAGLQSLLGYDGVVIAEKGDLVLVMTNVALLKDHRQAIIVSNSTNRLAIDRRNIRAAAIIELVSAEGPYAIFRRILGRDPSQGVGAGTKVLFTTAQ